ncbi:MAG TPA: type IX secretion system membrane protein PorP/SprF, partial [Bacteroidia bacterium]|nr:type IX secretion system membrane protein PorP/SprF [Bacteroidia bacterium]
HLYLGEHNRLGAGIQAGYAQRSMNYSAFQWGNQYDVNAFNPNLPSGEPSAGAAFGYADFGTGIVWTYENASRSDQVANNHELKINLGAGFFHVNQPAYSFYKTPGEKLYMRTSIHGSAIIGIPYSSFSLVPGFMYSMQGTAREIYAGTMIRYTTVRTDVKYGNLQGTALSLGAYLRTKDAVAAVMMLEYSSFAAGFSYDFNVSTLKAASSRQGGFEIALRYVFPDPFSFRSSGQSFY